MKIKTLITTILFGTSTMAAVASAHPAQGFYGESSSYSARDHRTGYGSRFERGPDTSYAWTSDGYDARFAQPEYRVSTLSNEIRAIGGQQETRFDGQGKPCVGQVSLAVTRGRIYVKEIAVQLANHQMIVQPVNRVLTSRDGDVPLVDLGGRADILRVIVYTPDQGGGAYQLLGA